MRRHLANVKVVIVTLIMVNVGSWLFLRFSPIDSTNACMHGLGQTKGTSGRLEAGKPYDLMVTAVIREFEDWANDVSLTVGSYKRVFPNAPVVISRNSPPYPSLKIAEHDAQVVITGTFPGRKREKSETGPLIRTPLVVFLPDNIHMQSASILEQMAQRFLDPNVNIVTVGVMKVSTGEQPAKCMHATFDVKEWTLHFKSEVQGTSFPFVTCDIVSGTIAIMIRTAFLDTLSWESYDDLALGIGLEALARGIAVTHYHPEWLQRGALVFKNAHEQDKRRRALSSRSQQVFKQFGVKLIRHADNTEEWHGCNRNTLRCFGTVKDDTPDYIFKERYTPPCCKRNIRETARYVFHRFKQLNVKYWLEGGSLLGAARNGDIIPWDYDVDVGILQGDISKSPEMQALDKGSGPIVTSEGFVWEKAQPSEGNFYRVQYSRSNRVHVDIFPFYEKDGTMTKDTWFESHRQDTEFPASFLKPTETLRFMGVDASVPNSHRNFLEFKFGPGVIENPRLPSRTRERKAKTPP